MKPYKENFNEWRHVISLDRNTKVEIYKDVSSPQVNL